MADMFGDTPPPSLDTSSDALEWEPDTTQVEPAGEATDDVEVEDDDPAEVDADEIDAEDDEPGDDDESDEEPDEGDDEPDEPSDDPQTAELRSFIGKQANEIGELRQMLQQALNNANKPQAPAPTMPTINVEADPQGSYFAALKAVDDQLADASLVEQVIAATAELDPSLSRQMERDFDRRVIRAEMAAEMRATVAPLEGGAHETAVNAATADLYREDADAPAYAAEVVRMVKEPRKGDIAEERFAEAYDKAKSRTDIKAVLTAAMTYAKGVDPTKSKAYVDALAQLKGDGQTETGNPPAPTPRKSAAEAYREGVFNAKDRDPGSKLFA